jgi:hypothetical protein
MHEHKYMVFVEYDSYAKFIKASNGQVSIPGREKEFYFLHSVQIGSGAHPASYPMGNWALSRGKGARARI